MQSTSRARQEFNITIIFSTIKWKLVERNSCRMRRHSATLTDRADHSSRWRHNGRLRGPIRTHVAGHVPRQHVVGRHWKLLVFVVSCWQVPTCLVSVSVFLARWRWNNNSIAMHCAWHHCVSVRHAHRQTRCGTYLGALGFLFYQIHIMCGTIITPINCNWSNEF